MATKDNWKEALVLSAKEFVKVVLLAVLPLLIAGLGSGQVDLKAVAVAGAIAFLNALNEFVKKWNLAPTDGLMG